MTNEQTTNGDNRVTLDLPFPLRGVLHHNGTRYVFVPDPIRIEPTDRSCEL